MKQGTILEAIQPVQFRANKRGRPVVVQAGQKFWVTSTQAETQRIGIIRICREGMGGIGQGWNFSVAQVTEFFKVAA